jgi:tetratricopeptide (TPR) repeat protein
VIPLFADEPEFAEGHAHLLGHLIGLDWKDSPHLRGILDDPKQIRNRAQHAAAQMFRRVSAQDGSPAILQLEDLHWADDESLDFLNYLAEVNRDVPLLILAFTRPTLFERRNDWRSTEGRHERIDLHPLDKSGSRLLANELLRKLPEVPAALRELITGGAEGNPFYMEELVRMLIDQGAINASGDPWQLNGERLLSTKVPSTLTGVLQARLDGLPADERRTLQEASVIGQVFWDRALVALDVQTEVTLPRLVQRELALPRHHAQLDGLREYAFRHAILHQVTYGTVLKSQRKALHLKLADWLAAQSESDSARAGDFLGLTAQHYAEAGEEANAAEFHARAAEYAAGRLAHAPALAHVQQALVLLDRAGNSPGQAPLRWRLLQARERTLDVQGSRESQANDLLAMEGLAETLADDARRAYAAHRRATRAMRMAQHSECEQLALRAVALADAALASTARNTAPTKPEDDLYELRLQSLRQVGLAMTDLRRWDEAQALLQKTLDEAKTRGLLKPQVTCLNSLAVLADRRGDDARGLQLHRESLEMLRQIGGQRNEAVALVNIGAALVGLGDFAGARRDLEEGLRLSKQNGDRLMECAAACNLSRLALCQGDDAHALTSARIALDIAVAMQARDLEVAASLLLGGAEEALGRLVPAAQAYAHSLRVSLDIGAPSNFEASAGLASVATAQGDIRGALDALSPLLTLAGESGQSDGTVTANAREPTAAATEGNFNVTLSTVVRLTAYLVLTNAGDARAASWLRSGHRALMAKADAISDVALREMFLTNIPSHRKIVALWLAHGGR